MFNWVRWYGADSVPQEFLPKTLDEAFSLMEKLVPVIKACLAQDDVWNVLQSSSFMFWIRQFNFTQPGDQRVERPHFHLNLEAWFWYSCLRRQGIAFYLTFYLLHLSIFWMIYILLLQRLTQSHIGPAWGEQNCGKGGGFFGWNHHINGIPTHQYFVIYQGKQQWKPWRRRGYIRASSASSGS